ncbi:MAG: hypothetical protein WA432_04915 [Candidatus Babeliaceae bacterium]
MKKLLQFLMLSLGCYGLINAVKKTPEDKEADREFFDAVYEKVLRKRNWTVDDYITKQHEVMRYEALKYFEKNGDLSRKDLQDLDTHMKNAFKIAESNTQCSIESNKLNPEQAQKLKSFFESHHIYGPLVIKRKSCERWNGLAGSEIISTVGNSKQTIKRRVSLGDLFWVYNFNQENPNVYGTLLHEASHLKNLHGIERQFLRNKMPKSTTYGVKKYQHYKETQADQYYASKNLEDARALEKHYKQASRDHWESLNHPAGEKRYQVIKYIKGLLKAQHRWPQIHYEKYGQPAIECMYDRADERAKSLANYGKSFFKKCTNKIGLFE